MSDAGAEFGANIDSLVWNIATPYNYFCKNDKEIDFQIKIIHKFLFLLR